MLTNSIWQSFHNIYVYQIIIIHLDLVNVVCQFYLNKAGGGGDFFLFYLRILMNLCSFSIFLKAIRGSPQYILTERV